jgi:beta-galactosidase
VSAPEPIPLRLTRLWHGGDYNPDQWPEEIREEDVDLMRHAGWNVACVGIFAWSQLEPRPSQFDWGWLDRTFERLHGAGIAVSLATPSTAHPRWLTARHPEVMAVGRDGRRLRHGERQRFCPTVPVYREQVARVNRAIADRYGRHPALALWHVSNEYSTHCWCDLCAAAFRSWLQRRYGDLKTLNEQWWSAFWSQRYSDWSQVEPPYDNSGSAFQGLALDWRRFQSAQVCDFFKAEVAVLREITPDIPVTTNLMGTYGGLDYAKFADVMDIISWDSYPTVGGDPSWSAFSHSLMRGLKENRPWLLLEQTPSVTNWQEYATQKPPGVMRLWSWQAIAHGSDSAMYFQWRRSRGGFEKLHGAVIEHSGASHTRVFRDVAALGEELAKASADVLGTRAAAARVGVLWDQENRWALEGAAGYARDKSYVETVQRHFRAFWRQNIPVDVVRMDADWTGYDILIAPLLYMVKSGTFPRDATPEELRARVDEGRKIAEWISQGGTFVATYLLGIVNESDLVYEGQYPVPLGRVLGLAVEETDCQPPGAHPNEIVLKEGALPQLQERYRCDRIFDLLHATDAEVLATYGGHWYAGRPCLTRKRVGRGQAWYIAAEAEEDFLADLYRMLAAEHDVRPLAEPVADVEVLAREGDGRRLLFLLNHAAEERVVDLGETTGTDALTGEHVVGTVPLEPYGVRILQVG